MFELARGYRAKGSFRAGRNCLSRLIINSAENKKPVGELLFIFSSKIPPLFFLTYEMR
jgi:hypothetical protein